MACRTVQHPNGDFMIVCSRGAGTRESSCVVCHRYASSVKMKLCDYPLCREKEGQTCSRPVCVTHAQHIDPDTDYCPSHARVIKAQEKDKAHVE